MEMFLTCRMKRASDWDMKRAYRDVKKTEP